MRGKDWHGTKSCNRGRAGGADAPAAPQPPGPCHSSFIQRGCTPLAHAREGANGRRQGVTDRRRERRGSRRDCRAWAAKQPANRRLITVAGAHGRDLHWHRGRRPWCGDGGRSSAEGHSHGVARRSGIGRQASRYSRFDNGGWHSWTRPSLAQGGEGGEASRGADHLRVARTGTALILLNFAIHERAVPVSMSASRDEGAERRPVGAPASAGLRRCPDRLKPGLQLQRRAPNGSIAEFALACSGR
jgi:hypothetical protein